MKDAIIRISEELEKKARKSELDLIAKQMKMFQPLEYLKEKRQHE